MTREWVWLDRAVIVAIHEVQLAEHGGSAGVRDAGCWIRPWAGRCN